MQRFLLMKIFHYTVSDIQRFLGMYSKLSKFVPNLADETKPLRDLCKDCPWTWEHP